MVKKCAPIFLYGVGAVQIGVDSVYKMHIAYIKKFSLYISFAVMGSFVRAVECVWCCVYCRSN